VGIDLDTGKCLLPEKAGIWDNVSVKRQLVSLVCQRNLFPPCLSLPPSRLLAYAGLADRHEAAARGRSHARRPQDEQGVSWAPRWPRKRAAAAVVRANPLVLKLSVTLAGCALHK
jgi:hypothetical protein